MTSTTIHTVPPAIWGETLSGTPILDRSLSHSIPIVVRRWRDIAPEIDQHALDQHFISVHLGGPKRLIRKGEGKTCSSDVENGVHSVVPFGAAFRWNTIGPVDFAHIYVAPATLHGMIAETFDRDPARIELHETLGSSDPLIRALAFSLLEEMESGDLHHAYVDEIVRLLLLRMLCLHSDVTLSESVARLSLAPFRLRRALEFIEANLNQPVGVADIAAASGISPYHFSRAFRHATGLPPYAYLLERRVAHSKNLLRDGNLTLRMIAEESGFSSLSQFSRMFRHCCGSTPTHYRNNC